MTMNRIAAALIAALGITTASVLLIPDHTPAPPAPIVKVVKIAPSIPVGYPPFWRHQTPSWCDEDMPCWIGSSADGRPAKEALTDWTTQMHRLHDEG